MSTTPIKIILDERIKYSPFCDNFATKVMELQSQGCETIVCSIDQLRTLDIGLGKNYTLFLYPDSSEEEVNQVNFISNVYPDLTRVVISDIPSIPFKILKNLDLSYRSSEFFEKWFTFHDKLGELKDSYFSMLEGLHALESEMNKTEISENTLSWWENATIRFFDQVAQSTSFQISHQNLRKERTVTTHGEGFLTGVDMWSEIPGEEGIRVTYQFICLDEMIRLELILPKDKINRFMVRFIEKFVFVFQNHYIRIMILIELDRAEDRFKLTQKALIQAEKLSVAGRMTASIAHEINNPLQGVKNCLHLLSKKDITEEQKVRYLEMTNQEMDRLSTTVRQMLEFYKPNEKFSPIQILEVIENTLNLLNNQLVENNIRIRTIWPPKIPLFTGIKNQIEQVLINLIINAKDAMPNGGELIIAIESIKPFLAVIIEDSGIGVPVELREKIFEPFISTKGTSGLGLSVCYEIIKNHSGTIELMDQIPDHGARFKIILPIKP